MPTRRSLLTQLGVLALGGAGAWYLREKVLWGPPGIAFPGDATSSGWLPFDASQRVIILDVLVNGAPVRALVDSGAQSSAIALDLAQRLGLSLTAIAPVIAFGVSGEAQLGRAAAVDVQAGALTLQRLKAAALQLGPITETAGVSLILGQDVLSRLIADIDFPAGRIALRRPDGFVLPPGAVPAPAQRQGRALTTSVQVEAHPVEVVVDTGASSALALAGDVAERAGLLQGRRTTSTPSIIFGGVSEDRVVTAREVRFAGELYQDVPVQVFASGGASRIPKGLLGVGLLDRFRVILDLGGGALHLLPEAAREVRVRRRRWRSA